MDRIPLLRQSTNVWTGGWRVKKGGTGEEVGKCQGNFKATKRDNIVEFQAEVIRVWLAAMSGRRHHCRRRFTLPDVFRRDATSSVAVYVRREGKKLLSLNYCGGGFCFFIIIKLDLAVKGCFVWILQLLIRTPRVLGISLHCWHGCAEIYLTTRILS